LRIRSHATDGGAAGGAASQARRSSDRSKRARMALAA
jgi:hypothetical protein